MSITIEDLDELQRQAVDRGLDIKRRCDATTGPAGSGKTTLMRFIDEALADAGYNTIIATPTGKAAKRVREATGRPSLTLHKLLEYNMPRMDEHTGKQITASGPARDKETPLEQDVVICDEYKMVPRELHANLVDALKPGARLLVFGDNNQLQPIESMPKFQQEPSAFEMLLSKFNGTVLQRVHRVAESSGILSNAQRILKGITPQNNDETKLKITDQLVNMVLEECALNDYTSLANQIITPSNKSWIGTVRLNARLQTELMPHVDRIDLQRQKWDKAALSVGVGDKVMMTKNWYTLEASDGSLGMFNGEVGIVTTVTEEGELHIDTGDRVCFVPPLVEMQFGNQQVIANPQKDIHLAYALTTHKAQGSEYDYVTYVMDKGVFGNLCRPNFYTGFTRGRKHVTIITDQRAMQVSLFQKQQRVWKAREKEED